ncbi:glycosyltransferase [Falsiroseomonas oryzae]|uniref:glycosyltransferase n=1 Tax=Falsiroseomonas oryzae TaxID=2766473 RepID=UPI0022EA24AD|nr:glycosyltransferase [Roseomonas sp. MO-31]
MNTSTSASARTAIAPPTPWGAAPLRILMLHNHYQRPGGEDACFAAEAALLEAHGHEVVRFTQHNDAVTTMRATTLAAKTLWNREAYGELRRRIRASRPAVIHAHNLFPLISPAAYYAAAAEGVPVVQTIHNFRLFCVNAQFFRDGRPCEDCLGRSVPWPGIRHACYRGSVQQSAGVAALIATHRALGTWRRKVDVMVALNDFVRRKLIAGGVSAERIVVKPNFLLADPGAGDGLRDGYALFAGRLSPEKGVTTLVDSWPRVPGTLRLRIVGDGPVAAELSMRAAADRRIELLGQRTPLEVQELMRGAAAVIVPSKWYELMPLVVIEAFAAGTPVLAARVGALAELVDDGQNGGLFAPGDPNDLAARLVAMLSDEASYRRMRAAARAAFLARYTAAPNYAALMDIYARARGAGRTRSLISA